MPRDLLAERQPRDLLEGIAPPREPMSRGQAATVTALQGASLGLSDEIAAGVRSGFGLWGDYDQELERSRGLIEQAREEYPVTSTVAEVGGGLGTGVGLLKSGFTLAGRLKSPLMRLAAGGVEGGLYGAAYGAGTGEGSEDRAQGAMEGAPLGAAFGVGGEAVGMGISALRGAARQPTRDVATRSVQSADEFGIPLSRGQATGDVSQQAYEQAAAADAKGAIAGRRAREFFDTQEEAVRNAGQRMATDFGGGRRIVESPQEASDVVSGAVRTRADALRGASERAYKAAESGDATIAAPAMRSLATRVQSRLGNEIVPDTFGTLRGAIEKVGNLAALKNAPEGTIGVNWKEVERVRRALVPLKGASADEGRLLGKLKDEFDGWFADAIDNALLSGDAQTIDNLKNARSLWSQYKSLTSRRSGDPSSRILEKIAEDDLDATSVANALFGVSKIGGKGESVKLAARLRKEFGMDSEPMNAIRQAAILKLMERARGTRQKGYQALASDMEEFLDRAGRDWARIVFTQDQLQTMRRFVETVKRLPPDARITNPSGSGYTLMRMAANNLQSIFTMLGFSMGGLPGAAGGAAIPLVGTARNAARSGQAFNRPVPRAMIEGGAAPAAIAGAPIDQRLRAP